MSYIVFARKWRPKTFDEIIGQGHITQTLKNAVKNDCVAHAYIFAGPRGIGKTSAARILAKALNCEKGPTPDPCNNCTSCKEISESRSLDVLEIDGASNRGIDEIRDLRANVKFSPTVGKFKIYIIDEVHMLTPEAFNALLKTLEEPPAHVKFIFATTQPNKVPLTILSRCQRFDFRKISTKEIVGKLAFISKEEHLETADEALFTIARVADGSMRDAESILDQLSSFSNKNVAIGDVTKVLGVLDEEVLFEMADAITKKDTPRALKIIDDLVKEGKDISLVGLELLEHSRNLLIAKIGKNLKELIDLPEDSINRLSGQSESFTIEDLLYMLNVLSNAQDMIKRSNLSRIPLEMAIVKLTKKESICALGEILDKISDIDKKIHQGAAEPFIPEKEEKVDREPPVEKEETLVADKEVSKKEDTLKEAPKKEKVIEEEIPLKQIKDIWPDLIKRIKLKKMSIASYLLEGEPTSCEGSILTLGFPQGYSLHKEVLEGVQNRKFIEEALSEILGRTLELKFITIGERSMPNEVVLEEPYPEEGGLQEETETGAEAHKDPIVDSALQIFKGRVINKKRNKK